MTSLKEVSLKGIVPWKPSGETILKRRVINLKYANLHRICETNLKECVNISKCLIRMDSRKAFERDLITTFILVTSGIFRDLFIVGNKICF